MPKTFAIRVQRIVTEDVLLYVQAENKDFAMDAAHAHAVNEWPNLPQERKARIGCDFSTYAKDCMELTGASDLTIDVTAEA